jgi:putative ABC transport system ATP-binding protein
MSAATDMIISTEKVTKEYHDNGVPVLAVRGIDLQVKKGEFSALAGPSGCGKTTLLNLISGLDTVTSGRVWLSGREISEMSARELSDFRRNHLGFVFQAYNLIPVLSVQENIEYIMLLQGVPRQERHERVRQILEEMNLNNVEQRLPTELSGGQQQRVAVARAIVSRPDLVLADEPTANLDSHSAHDLIDLMRRLNETHGVTFLFSTHDPRVMDGARRLIRLVDGMIESDEVRNGS